MPIDRTVAEGIGAELIAMYAATEARLTKYLADQLALGLDQPDWAARKLAATGEIRRYTQRLVAGLGKPTQTLAARALIEAQTRGRRAALSQLEREVLGVERGPLAPRSRLGALVIAGTNALNSGADLPGADAAARLVGALAGKLGGTHVPIVRSVEDAYRDVVARASLAAVVGTDTRRQVAQQAFSTFLDRGITGFTDAGGRRWSLSSYVEMATRTTITQASVEAHNDQLGELGIELVQVSDVAGECPLCRPWEGKILTRTGSGGARTVSAQHGIDDRAVSVAVAGSVAEAIAAGLMHPSCRHSFGAYIPGVTKAITNTHNPKDSDDRVELRRLEREVRKARTAAAAALTPEARAAARARVKGLTTRIEAHVGQNPTLTRRRDRERVELGMHRPPPAPPTTRPPALGKPPPKPTAPADPRDRLGTGPMRSAADRDAAQARWFATSRAPAPLVPDPFDVGVLQHNRDELVRSKQRMTDLRARGASAVEIANEKTRQSQIRGHIKTYEARTRAVPSRPYDPDSPLAFYGGRLHVESANAHTFGELAEVEAYAGQSAHTTVRDYLARGSPDSGIYYSTHPLPGMDDLHGYRGTRTRDGRAYEDVGGIYIPGRRVCCTSSDAHAVAQSQSHVGLHEFGHLLDDALGRQLGHGGYLSAAPAMRRTIDALERDHRSLIRPYFRASSATSLGYAETFANAFAFYRLHRWQYSGDELAMRVGGSLTGYSAMWPSGPTRLALIDIGHRMIRELAALGLDGD